jgi:hypothetical protein
MVSPSQGLLTSKELSHREAIPRCQLREERDISKFTDGPRNKQPLISTNVFLSEIREIRLGEIFTIAELLLRVEMGKLG